MEDKFLIAGFIFIVFVVVGALGIIFPEFMVKTEGMNTLNKKPILAQIKRYKISAFVYMMVGIVLIIITFLGGFKGV